MEKTMLIVDDIELNRSVLGCLFDKEFDIVEAESAEIALQILEACAGNIDVMILDVIMPGMTGLEMLEKYKNKDYFCDVPVVVITENDTVENQIIAFAAGASDYITKPFVPEIVTTRVNNVVSSTRKILDIRREREYLRVQSEIDQMTGLFNKTTGQNSIVNELSMHPDCIHALLMIDIDNFKSVNDNEGHIVGDQTIKIIANQIMAQFRKTDIITRFGGDEFCVFMSNLPNLDIARKKAQELVALMKYKPNLTIPANVSVSVGLAFSNKENLSYEKLMSRADEALYGAKEAGKARVYEYGQGEYQNGGNEQHTILLLSRSRNVCSNVYAAFGVAYAIIECGTLENLKNIMQKQGNKLLNLEMSIVDISGEKDYGESMLSYLTNQSTNIMRKPVFCCYEEGNLKQVKMALQFNISDILAVPFDMKDVQRVVKKYIGDEEKK